MKTYLRRSLVRQVALATVIVAIGSTSASAQDSEENVSILDEVIVTGTAGGAEQKKVDASFAITALDEDAIVKFAPKSTADLFKAIPGVWAESSGGVAGANILVRGFPGTGDAPFVTIQLEGVPIYTPPSLSFLENSTLFRVDETIERVEGLRGGPNTVLSNGQPGLTTNFVLKEGGEETEGTVRYTTADYGLNQFDAVLSGELADDLFYMVGGYVRSSEGVREAGFNAQEGNQFTANLTKHFEMNGREGKANFYVRSTDDSGTWYLPVPINVPGIDASYTQVSSANRNVVVEGPFGEDLVVDYGDGRGWNGTLAGGSLELELSDSWQLANRFNYLEGDADTFGILPRGGAFTVGDLSVGGTALTSATTSVTGRTLAADAVLGHFGFWVVRKDIDSLTNDLTLTKSFDNGSLSVGYYASNYGSIDLWNLNNNARYLEVGGAREQVDIDCATLDAPPQGCTGGFRVNSVGDARTNALYLSGDIQVTDQLRIDAGVRSVNHEVSYVAETGGDPVTGLTGAPNQNTEYDESDTSWTLGVNWSINDNMGVFARANQGSRLPYFDDIRGGQNRLAGGDDLLLEVEQLEFGFKYAGDNLGVYLTAFSVDTDDQRALTPTVGGPTGVFQNEATGLEIDASYYADNGFSLLVNATFLDGEIAADVNPALVGNQVARQPEFQARISPSFDFQAGDVTGTVYGALTFVGDRQSNVQNTQPLDSFEKIDFGLLLNLTDQFDVRIYGDNLSDEQGLTEGDPRSFDLNTNGRYILPRSWRVSVGYSF